MTTLANSLTGSQRRAGSRNELLGSKMQFSLSNSKRSSDDPQFAIVMVEDCLNAALKRGASDVHFQPRSEHWEISFRIDGVLELFDSIPKSSESDPVARLMALAQLPSYRGGIPQEGTLRWKTDNGNREMRVGVFPTVHGNRAAVRIMNSDGSIRQLDQLGFDRSTLNGLQAACEAREGWVLMAGPAGSGKTTSLYACLSHIAASDFQRSVLTIEDPIESVIDSISQSELQQGSGLTLASAMRSAVRQDAEVLLVSEIRDVETAEAVLAASMTGHLCFSSIHSGSIGSTLRRLVQMNLPTFAIESGLRAVLCQRLLRTLCKHCERDRDCQHCHGSGYSGRTPIAQLLSFDGSAPGQAVFEALSDARASNAGANGRSAKEIDAIASEAGIPSLHDQADRLVDDQRTTPAEVFRVLGKRPSEQQP